MSNILYYISIILIFVMSAPAHIAAPDFVVAKDGSGNYSSIQLALNNVNSSDGKRHIIFVKNGLYNEKLFIEKCNVAIIGESRDSTRIIYAVLRSTWKLTNPNDYGAAVVNIKDSVTDFIMQNLTVYNNYGSLFNNTDHQFSVRSGTGTTRIILDTCNIKSDGGDALSLWNTPDGMYYHNNCSFEGYVDYVCPRGYCFIENSRFYGHNKTASIWHDGSGREDNKFVIRNSVFDGVPGFPLGRHHRDAQFYLLDCKFSKNMADKNIYFYPSKPPITLKWNENRYYYYNCHGDSVDYPWFADNLSKAPGSPNPHQISALWTFNGKWDPYKALRELLNTYSK
ncbi:MAG: pectinesterase family protein [Ignavibacteriaceae bacterium]|nr:pectinesterase family protein [Ignavibacteriaceae bacterium]